MTVSPTANHAPGVQRNHHDGAVAAHPHPRLCGRWRELCHFADALTLSSLLVHLLKGGRRMTVSSSGATLACTHCEAPPGAWIATTCSAAAMVSSRMSSSW